MDNSVVSSSGVNKLQHYLGESNSVSLTSELMSPLLSNEKEGSEDIQQPAIFWRYYFMASDAQALMKLYIGANDVSMIQMTDVGVGISGQEGRQAVMASDFAMGQFRFLVPLLLIHGHWNYQRLGYMVLYNFYRNVVLVLVLVWYVLYTAFTLTTAINEWSSTLYSIIYSALPTIIVGILDKDLGRKTLLKHPQLYRSGQKDEAYNKKLFMLTMADTLWQSIVIFWPPLFAYWKSSIDVASIGDLWTLAVVILVNLHLAMDVVRWYWLTHASMGFHCCNFHFCHDH